jgi:hypothetical protein
MGCRYAGIDWASGKHDVLVAEQDGDEVLAGTFVHDEKGLSALCRTLVRLDVELVAIERPDGLLVERLLDAGLRVGSLIGSTRSCSASSRGPIITASGSWSLTVIRPRRSGRSLARARISWKREPG